MKRLELSGQRFGRLTVLRLDRRRDAAGKSQWNCRCDCGTETTVKGRHLMSGHTVSCGCLRVETAGNAFRKHGKRFTPEYNSWSHMRRRCNEPSNKNYDDYGGRGIKVCREWDSSFEAFFAAVGPKPSPQHSIDRYPDNDGHYEPGNVRWATKAEQANNKQRSK